MYTQKVRLQKYLNKHKSITTMQAMIQLGIMRLSERIRELEADGIRINHISRYRTVNMFGEECFVTKYCLKK